MFYPLKDQDEQLWVLKISLLFSCKASNIIEEYASALAFVSYLISCKVKNFSTL